MVLLSKHWNLIGLFQPAVEKSPMEGEKPQYLEKSHTSELIVRVKSHLCLFPFQAERQKHPIPEWMLAL